MKHTYFANPAPNLLRIEFMLLYIAAPVFMAVFLPPTWLFRMLLLLSAVGLALLILTPGFHPRDLMQNARRINWGFVGLCSVATALVSVALMSALHPGDLFWLPLQRPKLMLLIATLYPFISALPQELIYRALFFQRYRALLPARHWAIALNAAVFSFAHLMYWSWLVAVLTFIAGLILARAYTIRRNFAEAVALHATSGVVLFACGMGIYFYSGNVTRPF